MLAPDEGGGGGAAEPAATVPSSSGDVTRGAAAFEPVPKSTTGERALPEPKSSGPDGAGTEPAAEPAAPSGGFDASKFAQEFGVKLGETLKPVIEQGRPAEPPMTPEEAKKLLNVWEPDDNWYRTYDNLETRAEAVAQMRDGLIRQADTLNQFRMREEIAKLREELMPGIQSVAQTANQQREERLHARYPLLAKPELQPLVTAVANDIVARKQTFPTESEAFTALAKGVEAVLKVNNPEFKLEATENGSGQQPNDRGGRQLPVTTPGGGGGTGRRESSSKSDKPRGMAIFDK